MLKFSATLCTATARLTTRSSWRFTVLVANNSNTAVTSNHSTASVKEDDSAKLAEIQKNILQKEEQQSSKEVVSQIKLDLLEKQFINKNNTFDKQFQTAKSVNDLLDLATLPNLSLNNALKLISSITNQINSGKSQMVDIEADQRFIHLRKIVKIDDQMKNDTKTLNDDLSKYSQLSTPAMIAVIASLREQRSRNTPLLRMLSYNIVKYNMKLNLKQCATLLYSMAILNFSDKVLLEKIMSDLLQCLPKSTNAVTNKSIITSLGFLRYKNEDVLDAFCDTLFKKSINYNFQALMSIVTTFATLQYKSEKACSFIEIFIQEADSVKKPLNTSEWLDIVWSLAVLDAIRLQHAETVLKPEFTESLISSSKLNISKKLKLLNINAVAQFILKDYKGPFLNKDSEIFKDINLIRPKGKKVYIDALSETLNKLFLSQSYFKIDFDTNMGFLLDAEYHINDLGRLVPVENWDETTKNTRKAIMIHDYHDYCRGQNDLVGSTYLYTQLLRAKNYDLITISHDNFSIQDKIEKRIGYLKQCMKNVQVKRST